MTSLAINSIMTSMVSSITRPPLVSTTTRPPLVSTTTRPPLVSSTTRPPLAPTSIFNDPRNVVAAGITSGILLTSFLLITSDIIGRKRRDTNDLNSTNVSTLRQELFKVVTDLDDSGCVALALCHATSLPPQSRTTDHNTLIATLSPEAGLPVPWGDLHTPAAKFQYASFIGLWAALATNQDQCSRVFPSCPLPPADFVKVMANQVRCGQGPSQ